MAMGFGWFHLFLYYQSLQCSLRSPGFVKYTPLPAAKSLAGVILNRSFEHNGFSNCWNIGFAATGLQVNFRPAFYETNFLFVNIHTWA